MLESSIAWCLQISTFKRQLGIVNHQKVPILCASKFEIQISNSNVLNNQQNDRFVKAQIGVEFLEIDFIKLIFDQYQKAAALHQANCKLN